MCKVIFSEKLGFCAGVERAVKTVQDVLKNGKKPARVLHEIVHNTRVVNEFREQGAEFYSEPDASWNGGTVILSAHGIGAGLEKTLRSLPVEIIDATCPIVKKLHETAANLEAEGYGIIFIGKRSHRETEGVCGRLKKMPDVIENANDAENFSPCRGKKYALLSQTTLCEEDCSEIIEILRLKIPELFLHLGICSATRERQAAVRKLALQCKKIIIAGSAASSNSQRLREVAERAGAKAILCDSAADIPEGFLNHSDTVGIAAGASAPISLTREIACYCEKI